jgi:hypothetical protein
MRNLRLDHFNQPIVPHWGQASENRKLAPVVSAVVVGSVEDDIGAKLRRRRRGCLPPAAVKS